MSDQLSKRSSARPWVVVDSTVFGGTDRYLEGAAGRLLRDESAAGRLRLAVPTVVLLESNANYRRAVRKAETQLGAARDKLEQLRAPQGGDLAPRKLRYSEDLEEIVREADGLVLPIPDVPHARLIGKAVARRRPFDDNGDGYRDALVWETVLELLEEGGDRVILISDDRKAFSASSDRAELHPDLLKELADAGHGGRVTLYFEVRELTARLPEAQRLVDHWSKVFADNRELSDALDVYLVELANEDAPAVIGSSNLAANARNGRFVNFSNPRDRHVAEAWVSSDGGAILDVVATLDYSQQFEAGYSPASRADAASPPVWVTVTATSSMALRFEVLQRDRATPTRFAGRLVGWRDLSNLKQGGEPPPA